MRVKILLHTYRPGRSRATEPTPVPTGPSPGAKGSSVPWTGSTPRRARFLPKIPARDGVGRTAFSPRHPPGRSGQLASAFLAASFGQVRVIHVQAWLGPCLHVLPAAFSPPGFPRIMDAGKRRRRLSQSRCLRASGSPRPPARGRSEGWREKAPDHRADSIPLAGHGGGDQRRAVENSSARERLAPGGFSKHRWRRRYGPNSRPYGRFLLTKFLQNNYGRGCDYPIPLRWH